MGCLFCGAREPTVFNKETKSYFTCCVEMHKIIVPQAYCKIETDLPFDKVECPRCKKIVPVSDLHTCIPMNPAKIHLSEMDARYGR